MLTVFTNAGLKLQLLSCPLQTLSGRVLHLVSQKVPRTENDKHRPILSLLGPIWGGVVITLQGFATL